MARSPWRCPVASTAGLMPPMALSSRGILTTSDTAGHLMKAIDYDKARGAIVGKAMSALREGQGLVLVLIMPQ